MLTYHDFLQNWYLEVDEDIVANLSVRRTLEGTTFYYGGDKILTIQALTDADREAQSQLPGCIILYAGETVIYVAYLEEIADSEEIVDLLIQQFHPIRIELNTEEDE